MDEFRKYKIHNKSKAEMTSQLLKYIDCKMTEKDSYRIEDDRTFESGVEDIDGGDTFLDYAKWFFDNYEEDLFDN